MQKTAGIIEIGSVEIPELAIYAERAETQLKHYYEPEPGLFIAESALVIGRALDAGYEPVSMLVEHKQLYGAAAALVQRCADSVPPENADFPVYTAEPEILDGLTGYHLARGILCAMRRKHRPKAEELLYQLSLQAADHRNASGQGAITIAFSRIAVLENVMNPTNLGAIFRNAAALGMDAVLLTEGCTDPLYRRAARVSMGTVFQVPWAWLPANGCRTSAEGGKETEEHREPGWTGVLRDRGYTLASMALRDDTVSIGDPILRQQTKLAVILGSEGPGLLPETIAASDYTIKIPMAHGVDSLNVAAASAVAFWELGRQKL